MLSSYLILSFDDESMTRSEERVSFSAFQEENHNYILTFRTKTKKLMSNLTEIMYFLVDVDSF